MCGAKKGSAPTPTPAPPTSLEAVKGGDGNRSNRRAASATLLDETSGNGTLGSLPGSP